MLDKCLSKVRPSLLFISVLTGEVALFVERNSVLSGDQAIPARKKRESHFVRTLISK